MLQNTKQRGILDAMKNFGETLRDLRVAQDLGLRETATKVGISPAYLSRIERGKERPPRPEVIKELAKVLAADPDVRSVCPRPRTRKSSTTFMTNPRS